MMKIVEFECPVTFSDEEIRAFISEQIKDLGGSASCYFYFSE